MFVTLPKEGAKGSAMVWEDRGGFVAPVKRYASLDEVPNADSLEVWRFDVDTTDGIASTVNQGNYPTLDADGAPLWEDAKVTFVKQTHHINTEKGSGVLKSVDQYGGVYLVSDRPLDVYGRGGFIHGKRVEAYVAMGDYKHSGPLKGCRQLKGQLGDPYESGQTEVYVRLTDDPRTVATLQREPAAKPGMR